MFLPKLLKLQQKTNVFTKNLLNNNWSCQQYNSMNMSATVSTVKSPLAGPIAPVIKKTSGIKICLGDCDFV